MNVPDGTLSSPSPDLRDYLEIIKIRKWAVILILALVLISAGAYSLTRTPIYISEARVQVRPLSLTMIDSFNTGLNMETERALAASPIVARVAAAEMGAEGDVNELLEDLSVSVETDTEILVFQYTDPDPRVAQQASQAFAEAYLTSRLEQAAEDLEARAQPLRDRLTERRDRLNDTEERLSATTNPARVAELEARRNLLVNRIAILEEQLDDLLTHGAQNVGQIVKPAELPAAPASPKHVVNLAMAVVLGTALGVSAAFLMERLDDGLRGRADLELHAGVPVLAVVPSVRNWRKREQAMVVTLQEPDSPSAEAYRTLRTGVLFDASSSGKGTKAILLTSPEAGEGKTTTAANLGISLAQAGKSVILVSADLRRPRLQTFFKEESERGLTNILAGEERLQNILVKPRGMTNLRLLSSGPVPGNPAELLGSNAMKGLVQELREETDFVLLDAAPVLAVADSLLLAQIVDAVILVADAEETHRSAVAQSRMSLERVHARLIGAVLNNFDPSKGSTYQTYTAFRDYPTQERESTGNGILRLRRKA